MTIAIIGASGCVGSATTEYLLTHTDHQLMLFSHNAERLSFKPDQEARLKHVNGDILKPADILGALKGCQVAIYLVHLIGNSQIGHDFLAAEELAATNFAKAAKVSAVQRVLYVGGMGKPGDQLTQHLESREHTGNIIRSNVPLLIEFKVPMIIGRGAAGYEVLRAMVTKLPILLVPTWANALTQPITVTDVARFISAAVTLATTTHLTIEIGGPEQLNYVQIARRYAEHLHKKLFVLTVPFVPKSIAAKVIRSYHGHPVAAIAADMIASAGYPMLVEESSARRYFPSITAERIDTAF
jgi:uncharacterized protein YbjT (DUF2867 family)